MNPRSTEERARWMLTSGISKPDVRARICECDTLEEVYTWVSVYNEVQDQLPPGRRGLVETMERQAERIREQQADTEPEPNAGAEATADD